MSVSICVCVCDLVKLTMIGAQIGDSELSWNIQLCYQKKKFQKTNEMKMTTEFGKMECQSKL